MQTQWKHWSALYPACWQILWDRGGDFLWLLEPDGRVLEGNSAAVGLMEGMPFADALFWTLPCWLGARFSGSPHYRLQRASLGEVGELEVLFGAGLDDRRIQLSLLPVPDEAGVIPMLLVVGRELPRRRGKEDGFARLPLDTCLETTGPVVLADSLHQAMAHRDASLLAVCHLDSDGLRVVRESRGERIVPPRLLTATQRLREALAAEEFELYYQPKVCLRSGQVVGAEALLRWRHPERGLLLPGEFMVAIEEAELCVEVGKWVIETALAQADAWRRAGMELAVSVNVSSRQLQDEQFILHLTDALKAFPQLPEGGCWNWKSSSPQPCTTSSGSARSSTSVGYWG